MDSMEISKVLPIFFNGENDFPWEFQFHMFLMEKNFGVILMGLH